MLFAGASCSKFFSQQYQIRSLVKQLHLLIFRAIPLHHGHGHSAHQRFLMLGVQTSASKNPQVQFNALGYYTVTLTATNTYGSDSETKTNYILASVAPPVANFSASTTTPVIGQTVTFTDLSTNSPTSWAWSFSPATITYVGGTTSASQNPQVQFNAAGYYSVTLTATNAGGSDGETKTNYILASVPPPVANFSASITTPIVGQTVTFTDLSTNSPTFRLGMVVFSGYNNICRRYYFSTLRILKCNLMWPVIIP